MNKERFLTADIKKEMLSNAIPALGGITLLAIDSFLDGLIISRLLGPKALGGLTLLSPFLVFQTALGTLTASGASILISKAVGQANTEKINRVFFNLHLTAGLLWVIGLAFYAVVGRYALNFLSNDGIEIGFAHSFYQVFAAGSFIVIISLTYGALLRSGGEFKRVSFYLLVSIVVNVLLSLLLVPVYGMAGCAFAILFSLLVYAVLSFFQIQRAFQLHLRSSYELKTILELVSVGLPGFLFQFSSIFRQLLIIKFLTLYAASDIALYGVISRVIALMIIPTQALMQSFQPLYTINLGAKRFDRCQEAVQLVKRYALLIALTVCLLAGLFTKSIVGLFLDGPGTAGDVAAFRICLVLVLYYPVSALSFVQLQSSGFHKYVSWLSSARETVILLPLLLVFNHMLVSNAVYWAILTEVTLYTMLIYRLATHKTGKFFTLQTNEI
ncbi:MATE family efflux transporter [Spirosoma utsteinense]|uniref:Na+-driven multidrug efflux pump n=1 Tax=Spirosoma utsteinense TaxID=2585773 RepID=A0ABR6WEJ2_9BACT|nr:MATE family efflux transporter [Spirosoma utsteinense]MBC3789199.1 Na+-driven multidrug efflux pump [Spirosoma utsteinense]MBC3794947.1 Na+-driven multidrug efflux pump [Spirosoma utsteinense]